MEILTISDLILSISRRWDYQYPPTSAATDDDKIEIGKKLRKLTLDAKETDVIAIIGNDTWTALRCDCCENKVEQVVCVDAFYGDGMSLCEKCAERAVGAFEASK